MFIPTNIHFDSTWPMEACCWSCMILCLVPPDWHSCPQVEGESNIPGSSKRMWTKCVSQAAAVQRHRESFSAAISAKIISRGLASSLGDAWARHGCHDLSADLQRQGVEGCGWQAALPCHHWKLLGFPRSKTTLHDNHPLFCWATFSVVIRHTRRTMRRILAKESHDRFTLQPFAPLAQILQKIKCRNS